MEETDIADLLTRFVADANEKEEKASLWDARGVRYRIELLGEGRYEVWLDSTRSRQDPEEVMTIRVKHTPAGSFVEVTRGVFEADEPSILFDHVLQMLSRLKRAEEVLRWEATQMTGGPIHARRYYLVLTSSHLLTERRIDSPLQRKEALALELASLSWERKGKNLVVTNGGKVHEFKVAAPDAWINTLNEARTTLCDSSQSFPG